MLRNKVMEALMWVLLAMVGCFGLLALMGVPTIKPCTSEVADDDVHFIKNDAIGYYRDMIFYRGNAHPKGDAGAMIKIGKEVYNVRTQEASPPEYTTTFYTHIDTDWPMTLTVSHGSKEEMDQYWEKIDKKQLQRIKTLTE